MSSRSSLLPSSSSWCRYHLVVVWSGNLLGGVTTGVVTESCMPRWHGVGTVGGAFARRGDSGRELACGGGWRREPRADVWRGGGDVALFEESKNEGEKTHRKKLVWQKSGWWRSVQLWHDLLAEPASQAASSPPCRTRHTYGCWGTIPVSTSCGASRCETEEDDGDIDREGIDNLLECPPTSPMARHAIAIVLDVTPDTDASQSWELKLNACTISPTRLEGKVVQREQQQPKGQRASQQQHAKPLARRERLGTPHFCRHGRRTHPRHFRLCADHARPRHPDASAAAAFSRATHGLIQLRVAGLLHAGALGAPRGQVGVEHPVVKVGPIHAVAMRGGAALFGGVFKEFTVSVAKMYAMDAEGWTVVSMYVGKNVHGVQYHLVVLNIALALFF
ncbi:hypothetical protein EDB85DRAFT_1894780 [Lactarius pseudohatsudake]|nr:hypothetical protein EDB85DRAFT_1894780 [Lactarius pseudohatsudake]